VSLEGKTILLHAEQGSGDTIQFVRYASLVARRGAKKILLEVQRELAPLLSGIAGVDCVIARGARLPDFDLHCPLLSLPLAFATDEATIPADIPYLAPPRERIALWRDRLPQGRPLVGLTWAGDRLHDNDLNRSIKLAALAPLLDMAHMAHMADVGFVSLQHDVRECDLPDLQTLPNLFHSPARFADFADTAAVISLMDAVISVDTAVAHLAGAMGKPLFLLLPFAADFRWLRERQDSPWYPTARLYRQPKFGDWDGALASLAKDMAQDFGRAAISSGRKLSA
jgi:hypothetical protein